MKKTIAKIIMIIAILLFAYANLGQTQAVTSKEITQEKLESYVKDIDPNTVTKEDILKVYDEVSKDYSPENIADMLEENAKEIEAQGVSKDVISAGAEFIRQTDSQSIRKIIEDDMDIEDIKEKIQKGYTADQILNSMVQETPTTKKVEIATKVLLSNKIIKTIVTIVVILFIYGTILRWIIYNKAGKHGWAAIVPLYRQIVMYQVCRIITIFDATLASSYIWLACYVSHCYYEKILLGKRIWQRGWIWIWLIILLANFRKYPSFSS